jgi:hypothetical protein
MLNERLPSTHLSPDSVTILKNLGLLTAVAILSGALSVRAQAQQTPNVLYELDYAVSSGEAILTTPSVDTIVTIGMPHILPLRCYVAVSWYDKTAAFQGSSGPILMTNGAVSITRNFTSAPSGNPANAYYPYSEDIFRPLNSKPFEGYAQILSSCPTGTKLRVDAEVVTRYAGIGGLQTPYAYKPINVTNPSGASGY